MAEGRLGRVGRDGIGAKYRELAARRLSATQVERLYEQVMGLEKVASIGELTATLAALIAQPRPKS